MTIGTESQVLVDIWEVRQHSVFFSLSEICLGTDKLNEKLKSINDSFEI